MGILQELRIRNFRCFRAETRLPLTQSSYLVGANNAGKTAVLEALRCFFDDTAFTSVQINRTEFAAKQEGFNRADLSVVVDLTVVTGKSRQKKMRSSYGDTLTVCKSFTWRPATDTIGIEYRVNNKAYSWEDLPKDVREVLQAISVSYIHPQEGEDAHESAEQIQATPVPQLGATRFRCRTGE